jgi:hypothetical protein
MNAAELPSTLFTSPPDWRWLIILYFFVGAWPATFDQWLARGAPSDDRG